MSINRAIIEAITDVSGIEYPDSNYSGFVPTDDPSPTGQTSIFTEHKDLEVLAPVLQASLIANDIKYIHFNVKGEDFLEIHELCNEYYNKMNEDTDALAEIIIQEFKLKIPNFSNALDWLSGYVPLEESQDVVMNDKVSLYDALRIRINDHTLAMTGLKDLVTDSHKEEISDMINYWDKESLYKLSMATTTVY